MKKAFIIYNDETNPEVMNFIREEIENAFKDYAEFSLVFASNFTEDTLLEADAYVVSPTVSFNDIKDHIKDYTKVVPITKSPDLMALDKLKKIPTGETVLLVNSNYTSALETIQSFYEFGLGNIDLVPYDPSLEKTGLYEQISYAITPAEAHLVPKHIKNVIDIGYRRVGFETLFKLAKMLELDNPAVKSKLVKHMKSVANTNADMHTTYVKSYLKDEMINSIIEANNNGAIMVDEYYEILYANKKALNIFRAKKKEEIQLLKHIPGEKLGDIDVTRDNILIFDNEYIYDRHNLVIMNETIGYYITLEEASEKSEGTIKSKGFIAKYKFKDIIHESPAMDEVIKTASRIANTDYTVLIRGESGTGKELIAQSIHNASHRKDFPFVAINCAALPENLLESELFGYEKGSFTGANNKGKTGLFEEADKGTIFLDEIGDISPKLQAQLLRTIQERQIMRIGSDKIIDIDIRLITATNRDLEAAVKRGDFRSDLYFRLNVLPINLPPLRKRKEDIPLLFSFFLGNKVMNFSPEEHRMLLNYDWPGNVRELENAAIYYSTLSQVPPYISDKDTNVRMDSGALSAKQVILDIIGENTHYAHGVGRNTIIQELEKRNIKISDIKIREILKELSDQNYISIGKGRMGSRITEQGKIARKKNTFE